MLNQIPEGKPEDLVMLCLCFDIRMISRVVTIRYTDALAPSGLTPTQFSILLALQTGGIATMNALTSIVIMDRTTLSRNLKPIERDGFVKIILSPEDKRQRLISITEAGQQRLAAALPLWQQAQEDLKEQLGDDLWQAALKIAHNLHP